MRLLVVSNRLPVTLANANGNLTIQESVGGLVSGLSAYLDSMKGSAFASSDYVWVGWPGTEIEPEKHQELLVKAQEFQCHPVLLEKEAMERFYLGFCNRTIWPLFHYFPSFTEYNEEYWNEYVKVNQIYCDAVLEILRPDDVVWIHDYHLMLLPRMLREHGSNHPIGFFLHIPFPSYEIFRLLPKEWCREILLGMLGADLIGFHTHDYTEYFLRSVLRILGNEHNMGRLVVDGRVKRAETFPMGIDYDKFNKAARDAETHRLRNTLEKTFGDTKIVLSIDRLDYSKGVINRLRGYEQFLETNPQWQEKVMLSMVVVPSRIGVNEYQETKSQIDQLVGKINGRFGTIRWTPILYQYRYLSAPPLSGLYSASDVALITPLRDGMNLIAKEYLASRVDQTGVLVLSETAGAAKELGEAIIVNPNHIEEIAQALKDALEMSKEEQISRNRVMQTRLKRYNVVRWAEDFLQTLQTNRRDQQAFDAKYLGPSAQAHLAEKFAQADERIFFLDYDGTLVSFAESPQQAKPSKELLRILTALAQDPKNHLIIISGRDKATLENWFGGLGVGLVAEHGGWIKDKGESWQMSMPLTNDWKPQLLPIFERYADRVPGSFVEEKEFSIVWHYRNVDPVVGVTRAKELVDELVQFTANVDVQVLPGAKVIEVRNAGVNKAVGSQYWLAKHDFGLVLAAGDDLTDEDLFKVLPASAFSIKIGMTPTHARFNLRTPNEMIQLLRSLAALEHEAARELRPQVIQTSD